MLTYKEFVGELKDLKTIKTFEKLLEWSEIANKFDKLLIVQGGYAVDLAYGKITRKHDDLDLMVLEKDLGWFKERFVIDGYKIKIHEEHNPNLSYCAYKYNFIVEDSIYIDVEGINVDDKVWDRDDGKINIWPVEVNNLYTEINIENVPIKFLTPKLIYYFKKKLQDKGWDKREKEVSDFKILETFVSPGK